MAITPTLLRPRIHAGISVNWAAAVNAQTLAVSAPLERYAAAAAWLGSHSQPGELVFQTDWDDFPRLFFYDTVNAYTVGLDPTYLQLADEQLYEDWMATPAAEFPSPAA